MLLTRTLKLDGWVSDRGCEENEGDASAGYDGIRLSPSFKIDSSSSSNGGSSRKEGKEVTLGDVGWPG